MAGTLLIVDEDPAALQAVGGHFSALGYEVVPAAGLAGALDAWRRVRPDAVILSLHYPEPAALEAFEAFRRRGTALVVLLGHGFGEHDVRTLQLGSDQLLTKPMQMAHLEAVMARVLQKVRASRRCAFLRSRTMPAPGGEPLGVSPAMRALTRQIHRLAMARTGVVLLTGEPGTGKGWVARILHAWSPRHDGPFVEARCAAEDGGRLATELFGREARADGGGPPRRRGLVEQADGGTLFLHEFLALPAELQPAVFDVVQRRTFHRVGGDRPIGVDVRTFASTSEDVGRALREGRLPADTDARWGVVAVHLPPLRERAPEDREALLHRLVGELAAQLPGSPRALGAEALQRLLGYAWPGNVREMRNVLERALILAHGARAIEPEHLPADLARRSAEPARQGPVTLEEVERRHIERTLRRHDGNRTRAAAELGISRATLITKIKVYALGI
jgi:DNA-binding NtrC family response regulator